MAEVYKLKDGPTVVHISSENAAVCVCGRSNSEDGTCDGSHAVSPVSSLDKLLAAVFAVRQMDSALADAEEEFDRKAAKNAIDLLNDIQDFADKLTAEIDERIVGNWFEEEF